MVEYLKFNKEKLPVRVSYYALSEYKKETGEEFDEKTVGSGMDNITMFEPILFYSLVSGHRAVGKEMTIKRKNEDNKISDDMFELLEECFMQFANILPKFFPDTADITKKNSAPAVGNRGQRRIGANKKS